MEYRFEFDPRALDDAEEARDWIAESSLERAAKWYQGLFETIETLKTFPTRCPLAPGSDAYGEDVRQLLYETTAVWEAARRFPDPLHDPR
jgi:plasmid stabilization system protein ParE